MGISDRGTKAKTITSCDNAFVISPETLERATRVKRLIGRPQEALLCAKAKRQQPSAQPERKSTTRYGDELLFFHKYNNLT
ncbi:hypothetical protein [Lysinibacillus xylanilyticus]|uniref:hypothetical protein n=1 Tax=Lysinibacillus xylanilyticus TaxID=582475 RepID=UPI003CFE60E2